MLNKNPRQFEGLAVNLVLGLLEQCSCVQIFFCFFVERKSRNNSYLLWNKFRDYQVRFTLTDRVSVERFDDLTRHL